MNWHLFWWLSSAITLLSFLTAIAIPRHTAGKLKPIYFLTTGAFLASVLMLYPICHTLFAKDFGTPVKALIISVFYTIQFFTAGCDFSFITTKVSSLEGWIHEGYVFLAAFLIVLTPLLTFGFLLSFFKGLTEKVRHFFRLPSKTYVFSEINPRSISLAESIRNESRKNIIVFANVPRNEDLLDDDLLLRARKTRAVFYQKDLSLIRIPHFFACKEVYFFAICKNETESISESLQVIAKYKKHEKVRIYLFANGTDSELILNNVDKGRAKVHRVDPATCLVNHLFIKDGTKLFDSALPVCNDTKLISALVVGAGTLGSEFIKGLCWYCQMDGYRLSINVFDRNPEVFDRFEASCPDICDERYNGKEREGDAFYSINFQNCDPFTKSFTEAVKSIGPVTYVLIALGSDGMNIETAVSLRALFEQIGIKPMIAAIVTDPEKCSALKGAKDMNETPYNIDFLGDNKTVYSTEVILNSKFEKEALELHKRYNNQNPYGFYEFEYHYRSSMASVIHGYAREHCGIPPERESALEHKRWNAYMRSEGYIRTTGSRNDIGRMHPNLIPYDDLDTKEQAKDRRISDV